MNNEKLTYYWIEDTDSQGLKFDPVKGFTLAEIDAELKAKRTNIINGKFVHFGTPGQVYFNRKIIESTEDGVYCQSRTFFYSENYLLKTDKYDKVFKTVKTVTNLLDLEISVEEDSKINLVQRVSEKFGL